MQRAADVCLEVVDRFADAPSKWDELARQSRNIFSTREWAEAWWRQFNGGALCIATLRAGERPLAVLPLHSVGPRGARVLRLLGHGPADELRPVCGDADLPAVHSAIADGGLTRTLGVDALLLERLPAAAGWSPALGTPVLKREASPIVTMAGRGWEEYLADRSANFRGQVRRRERRLSREHEVVFRLCEDPARLPDDLSTLFELHRTRWSGTGNDAFRSPAIRAFHQDFAQTALQRGWLRLWLLEVDGEVVAAWYGYRFAGVESFYQSGRDPAWEDRSVGFVLMSHTLRAAFEDGLEEYRLLRGDEEYKRRFAEVDRPVETLMVPGSPAGRVMSATAVSLARARRPVGRALRRPVSRARVLAHDAAGVASGWMA